MWGTEPIRERVLFCVLLGLAAATAGQGRLQADWPWWRGPLGNGTWVKGKIPARFPKTGLPIAWKAKVGPGYSGITVAEGRVYTMDRPRGSKDERVICWSARTGQLLWEHRYRADYGDLPYGKGPRSTPTVMGRLVYTLGAVGHFCCLHAWTGKVYWQRDLAREAGAKMPEWGFAASPVVFRDLVILHAGLGPHGCLAAFDRLTGKEVWRSGYDPVGYATPMLFRYRGRTGLLAWTPRHIACFDPYTGKMFWRIPYRVTYGVSIATPIIAGDLIFVSGYWEGAKAIRLGRTLETARLVWEENRFLRGLMAQPLHRGGYGYLLDKRHGLVCFRLKDGRKVWTDGNRLTPRERNPQATMVWIGRTDHILALNAKGELVHARLTPAGYDEIDRVPLVGPTWAHPAYSGQAVFARDDQKIVKALLPIPTRARSGSPPAADSGP